MNQVYHSVAPDIGSIG